MRRDVTQHIHSENFKFIQILRPNLHLVEEKKTAASKLNFVNHTTRLFKEIEILTIILACSKISDFRFFNSE